MRPRATIASSRGGRRPTWRSLASMLGYSLRLPQSLRSFAMTTLKRGTPVSEIIVFFERNNLRHLGCDRTQCTQRPAKDAEDFCLADAGFAGHWWGYIWLLISGIRCRSPHRGRKVFWIFFAACSWLLQVILCRFLKKIVSDTEFISFL